MIAHCYANSSAWLGSVFDDDTANDKKPNTTSSKPIQSYLIYKYWITHTQKTQQSELHRHANSQSKILRWKNK